MVWKSQRGEFQTRPPGSTHTGKLGPHPLTHFLSQHMEGLPNMFSAPLLCVRTCDCWLSTWVCLWIGPLLLMPSSRPVHTQNTWAFVKLTETTLFCAHAREENQNAWNLCCNLFNTNKMQKSSKITNAQDVPPSILIIWVWIPASALSSVPAERCHPHRCSNVNHSQHLHVIPLKPLGSNKRLLDIQVTEWLAEAAGYERRGVTVPLIIYWGCASLIFEMEVQIKDSTLTLLLGSYNKGH